MANQEHIKILEQGVDAWNKWRDANPNIEPDLSGIVINQILPKKEYFDIYGYEQKGVILKNINFSKTKLYKANLEEVNLEEANLEEANLQMANLQEANLQEANLSWANLQRTKLQEANIQMAKLYEVNLSWASLQMAKLYGANLEEANLEEANLFWANLQRANLSWANLSWANLQRANLQMANLQMAKLSWANLEGVDLYGANLEKTNLHKANFQEANLEEANLEEANLEEANLQEANLQETNLQKANLFLANLQEANLYGANLEKANLQETNLQKANLYAANLEGADLYGANLDSAYLEETNIGEAIIGATLFTDIDLSEVKNLDEIKHERASSIGIDTIVKSEGKIPEVFLRGCGVPDSFIEYIPSIIQGMNPIEFYSCFISHSSKDKDFARRLHNDLQGKSVRTWFDEKDMRGGKKMHPQIIHNVKVYDKLLLILSDDSMNSSWVKTEIKAAIKAEIKTGKQKLFPIRLVDYKNIEKWEFFYGKIGQDLTDEICEYYIPDFSNWDKDNKKYQKEFEKLLRDIEKGKKKIS